MDDIAAPGSGARQRCRVCQVADNHFGVQPCQVAAIAIGAGQQPQRVAAGKQAGQSVADLQKTITIASLKSLANGGDFLAIFGGRNTPAQTQTGINNNILHMYDRLDLK